MASNLASVVGANAWPRYVAWTQRSGSDQYTIDGGDITSDGGSGFRYSRSVTNGCQGGPAAHCSSSEYTASQSYIGNSKYAYHRSGGSCFAAGTQVRMADGSLKRIELLQPGDQVAGPRGARAVRFVSRPERGGRALFSFADCTFQFTATQPFLHPSHEDPDLPTFVVQDHHRLDRSTPTLADLGVTQLEPGSTLLAYQPGGPPVPVSIGPVSEHAAGEGDAGQLLYDVVVAAEDLEHSQYFAGDERRQFLVASEIPVIDREPLAAITILRALALAAPQ